MDQERYREGERRRRAVLGDEYVDRATGSANAFTSDFQRIATEYCWGEVWTQPVLSDKQRSLNNLCILSVLNRQQEFALHVRGAIRNGCTLEEIRETLLQVTIYAGVPVGSEAFRVAAEVLRDEKVLED